MSRTKKPGSTGNAIQHVMVMRDDKGKPALTWAQTKIAVYLIGVANGRRRCWSTVAAIMQDIGIDSNRTVSTATARLAELGMVYIHRPAHGANEYVFPDWLYDNPVELPSRKGQNEQVQPIVSVRKHVQPVAQATRQPVAPAKEKHVQAAAPALAEQVQPVAQGQVQPATYHKTQDSNSREEKNVVLRTTATAAPPPALFVDIKAQLWSEGLAIVRELTGKLDTQARKQIGLFLDKQHADGDCAVVLEALRAAKREGPFEPVAWVVAAIQHRTSVVRQFDPSKLSGAARALWNIQQERRAMAGEAVA